MTYKRNIRMKNRISRYQIVTLEATSRRGYTHLSVQHHLALLRRAGSWFHKERSSMAGSLFIKWRILEASSRCGTRLALEERAITKCTMETKTIIRLQATKLNERSQIWMQAIPSLSKINSEVCNQRRPSAWSPWSMSRTRRIWPQRRSRPIETWCYFPRLRSACRASAIMMTWTNTKRTQ